MKTPLLRSIFAKHIAVMAITGVSLVLVVAFFFVTLIPYLSTSRRMVEEYTKVLAATSPDRETAARLADRLDLAIRYEGPSASWETHPGLPRAQDVSRSGWHDYYLAPGAQGGTYLVSWQIGRKMRKAHDQMLWLLHVLMVAIVFLAYLVIRHSLRPLRLLHEGVVRLSDGELDVVVPKRSRDEFGDLTEAFNQMVRRIRDMVQARDQLLADVSHELRSPLTRIKVALELLPEGEKRHHIAADIGEMESMITELLEMERLRGEHGLRAERRDLVPIVHEMARVFEDRPPGVRVAAAPPEAFLEIDGDRVRTVLGNLLENAIKYSLPDSAPVEITLSRDHETVLLRITDDGPGIPESDLENLFEPFFRVDRSRSKKTGGYGLGLSICRRIVEAHGGTLTAENNPGRRGATFTVSLPGRL